MSSYTGKICPYCKTPFADGDDIVVCSVCDMPHHKDCWIANQACTTFGCMGTIKYPTDTADSVTSDGMDLSYAFYRNPPSQPQQNSAPPYPPYNAGAANGAGYTSAGPGYGNGAANGYQYNNTGTGYGTGYNNANTGYGNTYNGAGNQNYGNTYNGTGNQNYGNTYNGAGNQNYGNTYNGAGNQNYGNTYNGAGNQNGAYNNAPAAEVSQDVLSLVGTNTEYYCPQFVKMMQSGKKTSWNWSAFLFAPYWFIYRRMYSYGIAALAVCFICSLLGTWVYIPMFAAYIAIGIFGNYIYKSYLDKQVSEAAMLYPAQKQEFLAGKSGTDTNKTVIAAVVYFVAQLVLILIRGGV